MAATAIIIPLLGILLTPSTREHAAVPGVELAKAPLVRDASQLEAIALDYLGRPYVRGGLGRPGFDCSGFVCRVYADAGYALPRVSRDQAEFGEVVDLAAISPGDLLFFAEPSRPISHVGLYLGDREMVHASSGSGKVVVANLDGRWFRDRLVSARRLLTLTATEARIGAQRRSRESVEHRGETELPMTLRRQAAPQASFGPLLPGEKQTAVGMRTLGATEFGVAGFVIAPELELSFRSLGVSGELALPIRYAPGNQVSIGNFDRAADFGRFIREVAVGIPGAAFEARLSRYGSGSILGGSLIDRVSPAVPHAGIAGLSIRPSPLSLYSAVREGRFQFEGFVDDVFDPGLTGVAAEFALIKRYLRVGAGLATDQQSLRGPLEPRAVTLGAGRIASALITATTFGVQAAVDGRLTRALAQTGFDGGAMVEAELRSRDRARALSLGLEIRAVGSGALDRIFGPTYPLDRGAHLSALADGGARTLGGVNAKLAWNQVRVGAVLMAPVSADGLEMDERLEALIELVGISVGRTTLLDLRLLYASRGLFSAAVPVQWFSGTARLRLHRMVGVELFLKRNERFEGGLGFAFDYAL